MKQELSETAGRAEQEQETKQVVRKSRSSNDRRPLCGTLRFRLPSPNMEGGSIKDMMESQQRREKTQLMCDPLQSQAALTQPQLGLCDLRQVV